MTRASTQDAGKATATTPQATTFGRAIADFRRKRGISQRDLAAMIMKDDGTGSISPQYLNDIEHDRRSPTSDKLIQQFAAAVGLDSNFLFVVAGKIPDEVRWNIRDAESVAKAFLVFRKNAVRQSSHEERVHHDTNAPEVAFEEGEVGERPRKRLEGTTNRS